MRIFKAYIRIILKVNLRVSESFLLNKSPLSVTFKGLSQKSAHLLSLQTMDEKL